MNRILNDHSPALFFEGSPQGEEPLRKEIAKYLYTSRGVSCLPDQIFIAAGTQQITGQLEAGFTLLDLYEDTNGEGRLHELNIPTYLVMRSVK